METQNDNVKLEMINMLKNKMDYLKNIIKECFNNVDFTNFERNYSTIKIEYLPSVSFEKIVYDNKNNTLFFNESLFKINNEKIFNHLVVRELLNIASANNNKNTMGIMDFSDHNRGLNVGIREVLINYVLKDNYNENQTKYCVAAIIINMIGFKNILDCFFNSDQEKFNDCLKIIIDDNKKINLLESCLDVSYDLETKYKKNNVNKNNSFEINAQKILSDFYYMCEIKKVNNNIYKDSSELETSLQNYFSCLLTSEKLKGWGYNPKNYLGIDEQAKILKNKILEIISYYNKLYGRKKR